MQPQDLDTACAIAMLQEEAGTVSPVRSPRRGDWSSSSTAPKALMRPRVPQSLPAPPPQPDKAPMAAASSSSSGPPPTDAALKALKAYRRALGLCFKCNAKWSKDHRCAPGILHAVEAIWDSFSSDDSLASSDMDSPDTEHIFLAISKFATTGVFAPRTVCLLGHIQQLPIQVLVDSGSSSSFINESVVTQLKGIAAVPISTTVHVAGGGTLSSTSKLQQVPWTVDDCTFLSDFRVLPLGSFDVVLGMDWLEAHSPMVIDWHQKQLSVPYQGQFKLPQGIVLGSPSHLLLQIESAESVIQSASPLVVLAVIQGLLD